MTSNMNNLILDLVNKLERCSEQIGRLEVENRDNRRKLAEMRVVQTSYPNSPPAEAPANDNAQIALVKELITLVRDSARGSLAGENNRNKIPAIKVVRQLFGFGLKEAKDLVDSAW